MGKRSDTLETVLLALDLLRRIPRGCKVTAAELHDQLKDAGFERDLRTIQRLLEMLSGHFPIECDDRSKPYQYRWAEEAKALAVPNLTPQESLILQLAERQLKNLLPVHLMKSMEGFFSQARRNLDSVPENNARIDVRLEREWLGKVRVVATSQPLLPPKVAPGVFETVSEALYRNRWLHLEYRNMDGRRTKGDVMPLGLAQQGPRLYLVGRYQGFDNERTLALHRILDARMSTLTFERPRDFNLKKYDDDGRFCFGEGKKIRLTFRIDKYVGLHLLESPLSADQIVKDRGDTYEICASVVDSAMLEWWLRGFGESVKGVKREGINEKAERT